MEENDEDEKLSNTILNILGVISFVVAAILYFSNNDNYFSYILYGVSYILVGYEILWNALKKLFKKDMFDENFLMSVATLGAFAIGEYNEAIVVLILYKVGEYLQDKAVENSKKKIEKALDLRPNYANLKNGNKIEQVLPDQVKINDLLIVKNGERVPLDGISQNDTTLDMSAITGEAKPKNINSGDNILSGSINIGNTITLKVTNEFSNSTVSKIIKLIQEANEKKSNTENFITKFSKIYTPIVVFLAILIMVLLPVLFNISVNDAIIRGLNFLVVSCPCALVISIPLSFLIGIGCCSKNGILVKGSKYIDMATKLKTIVFDKTGTITKGKFAITEIHVENKKYSQEDMLKRLVYCEALSNHYIAKSIINGIGNIEKPNYTIKKHKEIPGYGIICDEHTSDEEIIVGNGKLLDKNNIKYNKNENATTIYIAINKEYVGYIILEDTIKDDAEILSDELRKYKIDKIIMLTGDKKDISEKICKKLKFDEVYADLLPKDKTQIIEKIKSDDNKVAFVGDGINDSPVIASADIGIAMGKGSDIAIETADVVLMNDEPSKIINYIKISRKTKSIVIQNITVVLLVKLIFLVLSAFGISSMWEAVFADVGISLLAVFNCFRINIKNMK